MNEGGCDPDGRFYCGSMAYDQRPGAASLYRLDADRSVHVVLEGVTVSNGLEWSPDGSRAYYNDTATYHIAVFDYDAGRGTDRAARVRGDCAENRPDGLTVDEEGGVWVALSNGGAVRRYAPDGALDEVVEMPAQEGHRLHVRRPGPGPAVHHHLQGRPRARRRPAGRLAVPGSRRGDGPAGPRVRRMSGLIGVSPGRSWP